MEGLLQNPPAITLWMNNDYYRIRDIRFNHLALTSPQIHTVEGLPRRMILKEVYGIPGSESLLLVSGDMHLIVYSPKTAMVNVSLPVSDVVSYSVSLLQPAKCFVLMQTPSKLLLFQITSTSVFSAGEKLLKSKITNVQTSLCGAYLALGFTRDCRHYVDIFLTRNLSVEVHLSFENPITSLAFQEHPLVKPGIAELPIRLHILTQSPKMLISRRTLTLTYLGANEAPTVSGSTSGSAYPYSRLIFLNPSAKLEISDCADILSQADTLTKEQLSSRRCSRRYSSKIVPEMDLEEACTQLTVTLPLTDCNERHNLPLVLSSDDGKFFLVGSRNLKSISIYYNFQHTATVELPTSLDGARFKHMAFQPANNALYAIVTANLADSAPIIVCYASENLRYNVPVPEDPPSWGTTDCGRFDNDFVYGRYTFPSEGLLHVQADFTLAKTFYIEDKHRKNVVFFYSDVSVIYSSSACARYWALPITLSSLYSYDEKSLLYARTYYNVEDTRSWVFSPYAEEYQVESLTFLFAPEQPTGVVTLVLLVRRMEPQDGASRCLAPEVPDCGCANVAEESPPINMTYNVSNALTVSYSSSSCPAPDFFSQPSTGDEGLQTPRSAAVLANVASVFVSSPFTSPIELQNRDADASALDNGTLTGKRRDSVATDQTDNLNTQAMNIRLAKATVRVTLQFTAIRGLPNNKGSAPLSRQSSAR